MMLSVREALTVKPVERRGKPFGDLIVGEAFKWLTKRDGGDIWCMKLATNGVVNRTPAYDRNYEVWTYIEGPHAGRIFACSDADPVVDEG